MRRAVNNHPWSEPPSERVGRGEAGKVDERFTDVCARCAGFLVVEWCQDVLANTSELFIPMLRCVQCGHRTDAVSARNRMGPLRTRRRTRRRWARTAPTAVCLQKVRA